MSRIKKTLFITLLSLLIFISNVGVFSLKAEGESPTNEETTTKVEDISGNNLTFSLKDKDGETVKTLTNGDSISIKAEFDLPESVNSTYLTIDLGELKYITLSGGQENVSLSSQFGEIGTFSIVSNTENDKTTYQVKIKFDYEKVKQAATSFPYKVILSATGNFSLGDDAEPTDNKITIDIGDKKLDFTYKPVDSTVSVSKASLGDGSETNNDNLKFVKGDSDDTSYFYKKFSVTITSNGDNKNVKIMDTLSSSDISFVTEADSTNEIQAPTLKIGDTETTPTVTVKDKTMTVTVTDEDAALEKDASATLTYWVKFKKTDYSKVNNQTNGATVTYTNNNGTDSSATSEPYKFVLGTPGIEKKVEKVTSDTSGDTNTKKLKWTITITPSSYNDGYVVTDSEVLSGNATNSSSNSRLTNKGIVKISVGDSTWYMSYDNFAKGNLSLTSDTSSATSTEDSPSTDAIKVNPNGNNITIEYTNTYDVSDVDITQGLITTNTATITSESMGMSKSANAGYKFVPGQGLYIYKSYSNYDPTTGVITWSITAIQPADFSYLKLKDNPSGVTMNADLKVSKSKTDGTMGDATEASWTIDNGVYTLVLEGAESYTGKVEGYEDYTASYKKYVLTYSTKISGNKGVSNIKNTVGANYKYKSNGEEQSFNSAKYGDQNFEVLVSKSGEPVNTTSGKQKWTITFDVDAMDFSSDSSKTVTIEDILPENMELVDGSFAFNGNSIKETDISLKTGTSSNNKTFSAYLTSLLKSYKESLTTISSENKYVTLTYQTKFISLKKAYENTKKGEDAVNYTNTVTATYDGNTITKTGEAKNCTFNPDDSIEKTYVVNKQYPNQADYTILMNKGAAHLAKDGETTLSVTDNAGKSLIYKESTIKVTADDKVLDSSEYKVEILSTASGSSMTISNLPDEKVIKITYSCLVNVPANTNTANINDGSVENGISTNLADGVSFSSTTKINDTIKSADGAAYPVNASLKLTKVDYNDPDKKLAGAVYMAYIVVKDDDGTIRKATQDDVPNYSIEPIYSAPTDLDGNATISGLKYNLIYCIEEYSAPEGYEVSEDKVYVYFEGKNSSSESVPTIISDEGLNIKINYVYNFIGEFITTVADEESITPNKPNTPTNPKTNEDTGGGNTGHVLTCEEYMKSKDWTWSEKTKACVYRVKNTSTKDDD